MNSNLIETVIAVAVLIVSIVFHEVSHGYVAYLLGDSTAKDRGRLTLNPLKHVDPFGTVLMPLLMFSMFGFGFGYAKPVPIDPRQCRPRAARKTGDGSAIYAMPTTESRGDTYRRGMFLTGMAGPATNLVLAIVAGVLLRVLMFLGISFDSIIMDSVGVTLIYFVYLNLVLMAFNLIPLPPLDGSRVLPLFLSDKALIAYHKWERYGFIILFGVLFLAPRILGFDPINAYFAITVDPLYSLILGG
jgi:Zn-dependent protease